MQRNNPKISMAYVVVEFDEKHGGGVAAVNSAWLTPLKKEVFWPPYKDQNKSDKALKTGETVDTEKWTLHSISRIFYRSGKLDFSYLLVYFTYICIYLFILHFF